MLAFTFRLLVITFCLLMKLNLHDIGTVIPVSGRSCMVLVLRGPVLSPILFLDLFSGNLNFTSGAGQELLPSFPLLPSLPPW